MRIILGGMLVPTPDGTTIKITTSISDPVPTASVGVIDNTSSFFPQAMQELLIIDDQVTPYATVNMLQNPSMNPYGTSWTNSVNSGVTDSQITGGGVKATFANTGANPSEIALQDLAVGAITAGQTYVFSVTAQAGSPVNIGVYLQIMWIDAHNTPLTFVQTTGAIPAPTTPTNYSITATAPATAATVEFRIGFATSSGTNSGTISYTQAQIEPLWVPAYSYPTPFCGPGQPGCVQLPLGQWIRQYRKFAGFVTHATYGNYVGNTRTVTVDAVGYAWLMSTILCNNSFTNQFDSAIIATLLAAYLVVNAGFYGGLALLTTTNVVKGVQLSSVQSNWDDLRALFDNLASQSGSYWTVDNYWNMVYAPPGYFQMPITLICDNSSTPNMTTTFPGYNFSAEMDYTQPGSTILVIGGTVSGTTYSALIIDGSTTAQNGITSGYTLPSGSSFMRKVNEASLLSNADCTNRGMAELLAYDSPRGLYHLTANVELLAGYGIAVTSATDNLSATTLLLQSVTASWIGTNELLQDVWEYAADLGATNRATTTILSRIFRRTNSNTAAPAIGTTTLALIERLGLREAASTSSPPAATYASTILGDGPIAFYHLGELSGTVADDASGHAEQGTLNGGITLNASALITHAVDGAMTMNGTTGFIALPTTGTWPTGNGAWSVECWCKPTNSTNGNSGHLIMIGNPGTTAACGSICQTSTGGWGVVTYGGAGHDFQSNGTSTAGTIYYVAATYDGASHLNLYVGVAGTVTHYGPFSCGTLALTTVHQAISGFNTGGGQTLFFAGTVDEAAIYNYALSSTQANAHYTVGNT